MIRKSNIELVGIIAMLFIVIWHILLHGFQNELSISVVSSLTFTGVNLFILITGFWGINFRWKSLINLMGITIFYGFISWVASLLFFNDSIHIDDVINICLPISHNGYYWFISAYIFLFLLSPILAIALRNFDNQQLLVFFVILTYINCGSGWLFNNDININGYNTMHFIYIYIIGHCLARFDVKSKLKKHQWGIIYLVVTLIIPLLFQTHPSKIFRNNNPLVIISAISLFCFICSFDFRNRIINFIASCTLPVYLLQDGMLGQHIYQLQYIFFETYHYDVLLIVGFLIVSAIGFFVVSALIEPVRRKMMSPFIDWISRFVEKYKLDIFCIPKDSVK